MIWEGRNRWIPRELASKTVSKNKMGGALKLTSEIDLFLHTHVYMNIHIHTYEEFRQDIAGRAGI